MTLDTLPHEAQHEVFELRSYYSDSPRLKKSIGSIVFVFEVRIKETYRYLFFFDQSGGIDHFLVLCLLFLEVHLLYQ